MKDTLNRQLFINLGRTVEVAKKHLPREKKFVHAIEHLLDQDGSSPWSLRKYERHGDVSLVPHGDHANIVKDTTEALNFVILTLAFLQLGYEILEIQLHPKGLDFLFKVRKWRLEIICYVETKNRGTRTYRRRRIEHREGITDRFCKATASIKANFLFNSYRPRTLSWAINHNSKRAKSDTISLAPFPAFYYPGNVAEPLGIIEEDILPWITRTFDLGFCMTVQLLKSKEQRTLFGLKTRIFSQWRETSLSDHENCLTQDQDRPCQTTPQRKMKVKIIDFSNWSVGGLNTKLGIDPCTEWYSAREGVSFAIEYNFENSLPLDYGLDYADKLLINWPIKEETRPITRRNLLNRIKRAVEAKLKPLLGDLLTWDKYAYDYSDYVAKNYYQRMYLTWK